MVVEELNTYGFYSYYLTECHELSIYVDLQSLSLCTIKSYNLFVGQPLEFKPHDIAQLHIAMAPSLDIANQMAVLKLRARGTGRAANQVRK
jgi:hypothetical protein